MTTPNIGLIELSNTAGNYLLANESFAIIDALLGKVVKDKDLNTPPGSPQNGDVYIIGTSPTGLWAGHAKKITFYSSTAGAWVVITPKEGWKFEPVDEDQVYRFDGTNWVAWSAGGSGMTNPMTTAGDLIVGGASGTPARLAKGTDGQVLGMVSGAQAWVTPSAGSSDTYQTTSSSSGVLTLDRATANYFGVTLSENVTTLTLSGATAGTPCVINAIFKQPSGSIFSVTKPASVILPNGISTLVSENGGDITLVAFLSMDGGTSWLAERRGVFSSSGSSSLPPLTGENETFLDEGTATTGWAVDYGTPTLSIVSSNLHLVGNSCAIKKTLSAPASGDFLLYFKIKGSQAVGQYWSVYFTQGATLQAVVSFGYNWVSGAAANGTISIYANAGAEKKVLKTGADYTQYVEMAIHQDVDRNCINVYMKDANDKWQYITHLSSFSGLRAINTVKMECGTATSATLDCDYFLVAKPNAIVIGDSLAAGAIHFDPNPSVYGGDDDNSTTWMKHALIYRSRHNSLIVNKGIGSQTSTQILARIAEVTAHGPKVVFLQASSNDATGGVSQGTRTSNVQSTINACTAIGAAVVLLNAAYPNSNHASGATITAYDKDWWDNYRPTLTGVTKAIDIMQPVLSGGVMNPTLTESDGIHPTAAGYQAIGEYIKTFE